MRQVTPIQPSTASAFELYTTNRLELIASAAAIEGIESIGLTTNGTLLDEEAEIVPGIGVLPAPGHTPGHMVVSVSSGSEVLLYIADTVLHPLHLEHPDWCSIYDIAPERARASTSEST